MTGRMSRQTFLLGLAAVASVPVVGSLIRSNVASAAGTLWSQLYGPNPSGPITVTGPVVLDIDATVESLTIAAGADLTFDPSKSVTLQSRGNVIVDGALHIRPASASVVHTVRFLDVNEAAFVGGPTHVPIASDVGLWMTNHTSGAHLDIAGTAKRGWTRLTGAVAAGTATLTVENASGWRPGDELVIAPTTSPNSSATHYNQFDRRTISAVSGNTVTLTAPLAFAHPTCTMPNGKVWAAEVCNLTRNVRIQGQVGKRAHIFIHGGTVDAFRHVEISNMGPRQVDPADGRSKLVSGRYCFHLHHMADATRGLAVDGVVVHDAGNRGFVPHGSHGVTFTDCVYWDGFDEAYWWDVDVTDDQSHDITYDRCVAGRVDTGPPLKAVTGFHLSGGERATIRNCAAFGVLGTNRSSGFHWPDDLNLTENNVWTFEDNLAHNNKVVGTFGWQNDWHDHVVTRLHTYRCGTNGLLHGAYGNVYRFTDCESTDHGGDQADFALHAQTPDQPLRAGRVITVTGGHLSHVWIAPHSAIGGFPAVFRNVAVNRVTVNEINSAKRGLVDFIDCGLTGADVKVNYMHAQSVVRVQSGSQAWKITPAGMTSIPPFA